MWGQKSCRGHSCGSLTLYSQIRNICLGLCILRVRLVSTWDDILIIETPIRNENLRKLPKWHSLCKIILSLNSGYFYLKEPSDLLKYGTNDRCYEKHPDFLKRSLIIKLLSSNLYIIHFLFLFIRVGWRSGGRQVFGGAVGGVAVF